ncbi:sensor domain-containing diguanylate cyclase [Psychromonas aquimarina]|uniref:sensor domain-containing diguanylate cyclase n=1 Tax=Psychromonas aquimarina TaxID=444919 RepID=UPI00042211B5|nr:GGDEF domain-containing protein [Psychromonas aquimarina]
MGLTQRLYLFSLACFGLMITVFYIIFWSWITLSTAMSQVDYTQRVGEAVDQLQLNIFKEHVSSLKDWPDTWMADQQNFTRIISSAPALTPQQQTLHNSIVSQNGSLIILFKQIKKIAPEDKSGKIAAHLNARLLTQIELIREDCLQLASSTELTLRNTIRELFYLLVAVFSITVCGLTWGIINVSKVFNSSIKDLEYGIANISQGNYKQITLSQQSTEFNKFAAEFNAMSKKLAETTVSRDSLQKLVQDRTEALVTISNTDQLTNVANRRALYERGQEEFLRAQRHQFQLTLLMIDCDYFKNINDTYGHLAGDQALQHLCRVFEKVIRDVDFLARYGGEEFVIILPHCDEAGGVESAKRLQAALSRHPFVMNTLTVDITVSIGIVVNSPTYESFDVLLNDADEALFAAKNNGRNRFEIARKPLVQGENVVNFNKKPR